jgi:hypothetical protein
MPKNLRSWPLDDQVTANQRGGGKSHRQRRHARHQGGNDRRPRWLHHPGGDQRPLCHRSSDLPQCRYDPVNSFAPIAFLASAPDLIVVRPDIPAATLQEFITYAKANPGKVAYAAGNPNITEQLLNGVRLGDRARLSRHRTTALTCHGRGRAPF